MNNVLFLGRFGTLALIAVVLVSCSQQTQAARPRATRPIATLFPTLPSADPASPTILTPPPADTGWIEGPHSLALRRFRIAQDPGAQVIAVRIDPAAVQLQVGYTPEHPRSLQAWFTQEQPLLVINGGFFTEEYLNTALVVSNGVASGSSYEGFGGMLAVAPDGSVSLQALRDQPYAPEQPLTQALQSFPMLIFPGGIPSAIEEDHQRARRTAVAFDRTGRLIFLISPTSTFSLRGFADWLAGSELAIERALNLDGGSSTGLYLQAGVLNEQINSFGPVPSVLLVRAK